MARKRPFSAQCSRRSDLPGCLGGLARPAPLPAPALTPRLAGLAHVPEDRQTEGLVIQFEEWENNILGYQHDPAYGKG